jgi:putative ABC transport system permease protein
MLSGNFLKLVILSIVLVSPLTWFIMNRWLQNFSYRIHIDWWIFALSGLASLFIALITVSFQAIRAAAANPIQSLRSE